MASIHINPCILGAQDPFLSAEEAIAQGFADKVAGLPTANRTAA